MNTMTFQNEIEIFAQRHNLTLSVWRTNKSGRTIVTVALHTGDRAAQFRYQTGVVWSGKQTVELTGQFVGADISNWCDVLLNEAQQYLKTLDPQQTYSLETDLFGGDAPVTISDLTLLVADFSDDADGWAFELSVNRDVRIYATRLDSDDIRPTHYDNWVKITRDEWYLVIARPIVLETENV